MTVNNSTNYQQKEQSPLSLIVTEHEKDHDIITIEIKALEWDIHVAGWNGSMGSQPFPLDNLISNRYKLFIY